MSKRLDQSGYTLIELIVATAVMSILLLGIMGFLVNTMVNNAARTARADLLREAQLALDVMVKDIRLSSGVLTNNSIEDSNSPNAGATAGLGWESDGDTLIIASTAEDTSRAIIFEDDTHYLTAKNNIVYYVEDGVLYKRSIAADFPNNATRTTCPPEEADDDCPADRLSVRNVQGLQFRYFNANDEEVDPDQARSVEMTLTLHDEPYGRPVDVSYTTRTVFRNE